MNRAGIVGGAGVAANGRVDGDGAAPSQRAGANGPERVGQGASGDVNRIGTATGCLPDGVVRQAAVFQMRLWSGMATDDDHEACRQWRAADPAHELAWQRVSAIGDRMQAVPRDIAGRTLRDSKVSHGRRKAVRTLGLALTAGLAAGYSVRQMPAWQRAASDHATGIGEWGHVMLPDGTRVDLNTASAVDVAYTDAERGIRLRTGEILVTSAPDAIHPSRPLRVHARHGVATALGTRYSLREFDGHTQLAVFQGAVELSLRGSGLVQRVPTGLCVDFDTDTILSQSPASENDIAWTRGLIIAERMPLGKFLEELQRYRYGLLQCAPAVASHPLTGVFSLRNTEAVIDALQQGLPVRQQRLTRYWVRFLAA